MKSPAGYLVLFSVLLGLLVRPARAEITPEAVREAIDRGVGYLKRQQLPSGGWPEYMAQPCGASALITLALLNAGVPATDPTIKNALDYLRKFDANDRNSAKTYSVALQTMVFCRAEPKNHLLIGRNVRWLEKTQNIGHEPRGAWSYPGVSGDNSNSQFAVLALYDAERVGIPVKPPDVAVGRSLLERLPKPGRLLGIPQRSVRHGEHDRRRDRLPRCHLGPDRPSRRHG